VELSDDPDLYFFTHSYDGKHDYLRYNCHRVFLGWENERADWRICDYVLDSDFMPGNPRHKRWPLWAAWDTKKLLLPKQVDNFLAKQKFACLVVSNPYAKERIEFYHQLSKYKKVDSGGKLLNNVGGPVSDKNDFIRDYKFVISFENSSYPGYTTEKIIEPMLVNSIPIYWGNPEVGRDFNTKSFVHVNQFSGYKEAIEYIIALDEDEAKSRQMSGEPWFVNNQIPDEFSTESLEGFFDFIVSDMKLTKPVGASSWNNNIYKARLLNERLVYRLKSSLGLRKPFR
jgi:hypothetical protein